MKELINQTAAPTLQEMVKKMTPRDCALLGLGAVGIVGICYRVKAVVSIVAEKMS